MYGLQQKDVLTRGTSEEIRPSEREDGGNQDEEKRKMTELFR